MHPLIPQAVGLLAVCLFLLSYQQKKRQGIILCNTLSRLLYILQYLLLGAYAGAVLDVLGAVSSLIAARKDRGFVKRHTRSCLLGINAVILAAGLLVYRTPLDLLPIAGVILHTSAFWIDREHTIRCVSLIGSPFWLAYNFASRAYFSALGDLLTMGSILVAMLRYRKRK